MPVHVEKMSSDVTVLDAELPLSEAQIDKLVQRVLQCLEEQKIEHAHIREATELRRSVIPTSPFAE